MLPDDGAPIPIWMLCVTKVSDQADG